MARRDRTHINWLARSVASHVVGQEARSPRDGLANLVRNLGVMPLAGEIYRQWIESGIALKGDALSDAYEDRIAELEERVAFVELQACHAINAIDKGDIADARLLLEEATRDMFKP